MLFRQLFDNGHKKMQALSTCNDQRFALKYGIYAFLSFFLP